MLSCRETSRLIAQDELGASALDRIGVRLHLLMCRFCRRYRAQVRAMGAVCRDVFALREEDLVALARLERSILDRHAGPQS